MKTTSTCTCLCNTTSTSSSQAVSNKTRMNGVRARNLCSLSTSLVGNTAAEFARAIISFLLEATLTSTVHKYARIYTPTTTVHQRLCNVNYCRPDRILNLHCSTANDHIVLKHDYTLAKPNIQRRAFWVYYPRLLCAPALHPVQSSRVPLSMHKALEINTSP